MNQRLAKKILNDMDVIQKDGSLADDCVEGIRNIDWTLHDNEIWLCDNFTPDQLEAIAWWMRKYG